MARCTSCHKVVYWGKTKAGKPCPFDDPARTESHFRTCPSASKHSKSSRPVVRDSDKREELK